MIEQSHSTEWQRRGKFAQPLARVRESPPASTSISRNPPTGGFPPDLEADSGR